MGTPWGSGAEDQRSCTQGFWKVLALLRGNVPQGNAITQLPVSGFICSNKDHTFSYK